MKWRKGESGNPGGRPKEAPEVKALARRYTEEAIERLAHWLRSDDARASVAAAGALLDRGWGRPRQPVSGEITEQIIVKLVQFGEDVELLPPPEVTGST